MSEWRVNERHPTRYLAGLDYERCAALHNLIVERGWKDSGRKLEDLDKRTWWDVYGDQADSERLHSSVTMFLKAAWVGFSTADPQHIFHRSASGLCPPRLMWNSGMYAENEDNSTLRTYLTLYQANHGLCKSQPLGVVFNQRTHRAIYHTSQHDISITMNGRQSWLHLETILEGWLDMIDQGKIVAVDDTYSGKQQRTAPWIMPSYTETDLEETVELYNRLVETIEYNMGNLDNPQPTSYGLLDSSWTSIIPEGCFARRFLEGARIPRFTYIAPGLRIARKQPFLSFTPQHGNLRPFLLFEGQDKACEEKAIELPGEHKHNLVFQSNVQNKKDLPSGLYLTDGRPTSTQPFEDGCKLLLPYSIGENGWARTSDDALFGEDLHAQGPTARPRPKSTQVYQSGFNHFIDTHDVQLKHVLKRWIEMVRTEKWEVDADGVKGGIGKWMDADTGDEWQLYQLPMTW